MKEQLMAGRFLPIRKLGQGGMAEVILARDAVLEEETALKIIHPHLARDPALRQRFRTEVQVSRTVRHPGIIEVRELFEDDPDGRFFISMEYLPGGDLKQRIAGEGALPAKEVERIAVECLEALAAAHAKGVVHRDLKPQNILFDASGRARITDFGIARLAAGSYLPDSALAIGTPDYCPPEIMRGESADGRSDIYSLGVALFEAATGSLPFESNSPYRSMKLRATQDAPRASSFNPGLPARLDDAIARAMERDGGRRFQTARAFLEALRRPEGEEAGAEPKTAKTDGCVCPDCGAEVPRSLSWCFSCGRPIARLKGAQGGNGYKVVVTGPGKPGDKLDPEQRETCLRLASGPEVDASRLGKRIPRLPFTLAKGLSRRSAESVVDALSRSGIEAVSLGRDSSPEDKALARAAAFKEAAVITPRIWLILLASSASFLNSIFKIFVKAPEVGFIAIAAWLLVPPAAVVLRNMSAFAKLRGGKTATADPPLLEAAPALARPELRQLASDIAQKRDALDDALASCSAADESDRGELEAGIDAASLSAASDLRRAQSLHDAIAQSGDDAEARELERELDETKARILGRAAAFDSLTVRLSGLSLAEGRKALGELEADLRKQSDLDAGIRGAEEASR